MEISSAVPAPSAGKKSRLQNRNIILIVYFKKIALNLPSLCADTDPAFKIGSGSRCSRANFSFVLILPL
jgi:hypothetical protein